ncbi:hypothetical protein OJF2_73090 [Aquisphaera giovannonii]|uniref:DUF1257 domain-containing protein n=1 Tax=Aquisphaera giovannonii TaxID=406548 RepID=A0A5B9WE11_9BACT|nr:DUF1257 domain-containing protein [Aquisphaera giovannonii]QEH38703.1 hypothetical protein OJF2_73090 [Aquisphaera giovannonii]
MSTVLVVSPLLVASWPLLSAAITAAVSSMGYATARAMQDSSVRAGQKATARAEIELEDSEILAGGAGTDERLVVERDGILAIFSRDARGALKLCVEGAGRSKAELKQIGEALVGRVAQQYAYHRLMTELKDRDMTIIEERVGADQAIHIRVRNR